MFNEACAVMFTGSMATQHGGAILYVHDNSSISFVGSTKVAFHHNVAESDGGTLYTYDHCRITIGKYL